MKYFICLPAHVTINQQKTINIQMCYLIIKLLFLKSQGDLK